MTVSIGNIEGTETTATVDSPVASAVAQARQAAGYSIEDLALTTGLVHDELAAIENGTNEDPAKLKRIAAALKIPPSALLLV